MRGFTLRVDWSTDECTGDPAHHQSADGRCRIWFDGRLDDRAALAATLASSTAHPDARLLLDAYRRWGRDCAARLVGDFAFVIWDSAARRLYGANDPLQMRTLYYADLGDAIVLASSAAGIFALGCQAPLLDRGALAAWLAGWPDPDRSLYRNAVRLPSAHWLQAGPTDIRRGRFWDIDPARRIRHRDDADYARHLDEVLRHCVGDRLASRQPTVAAQLSGGLDSSTVCAVAAPLLAASGRTLATLSHAYPADTGCDESAPIRATIDHLGIREGRTLTIAAADGDAFTELYPPTWESPGCVASPRHADEMQLVRELGADVLLTGSGGDEMVWGHSLSYTQRLRDGDLGVVLEVVRGSRRLGLPLWQTLVQLFVRPFVAQRARDLVRRVRGHEAPTRVPDWIPASARDDLAAAPLAVDDTPTFDNPALQARYHALRLSATFNVVRSYDHVAAGHGVAVRHPFFDRRLAEFCFAIPHEQWIRQHYPKWLLRQAMRGRLPDAVVWNPHKVTFNRFFGALLAAQAAQLRPLLADRRLEDLGLLDTAAVMRAFDGVVRSRGASLRVDLLYVLLTQLWLRQFGDDVSVA
ncbi:MAG: asparagine synthase-related protein [Gammaproteobacteria bacterium]|nr:asparagine synthase-related protein [Gammaproteobacteria bacterium]